MHHIQHENRTFGQKKSDILSDLSKPDQTYTDLSPKGSVDFEIRELIDMINDKADCVTTSSCAGRISVFLEAADKTRKDETHREHDENSRSSSIKGSGGRWLFVSHQPLDAIDDLDLHESYGLARQDTGAELTERYVHFKFEPMVSLCLRQLGSSSNRCEMRVLLRTIYSHSTFREPDVAMQILHILAASLSTANVILTAGHQAGFRESGISGALTTCPIVAIRSSGLALESIVGAVKNPQKDGEEQVEAIVSEAYLRMVTKIANGRFRQNTDRISRLRRQLEKHMEVKRSDCAADAKEEKEERRRRKKAEGLLRRQQLQDERQSAE